MAINTDLGVPIPIFNGEDFWIWKIKFETYLKCLDLWDIVVAGYEEPDWSSIEGDERVRRKEEQRQNVKALMELRRGINSKIFPLISTCKKASEIWRILNENFNVENEIAVGCSRDECNLQDDVMGKEKEPILFCENVCIQICRKEECVNPCEECLQEEIWKVYKENFKRRGVFAAQGRGGRRGFSLGRGKEQKEEFEENEEECWAVSREEEAHEKCYVEEEDEKEWERESHVVAAQENEEEEDVFEMCFKEEAQDEKDIGDGYWEMARQVECFNEEAYKFFEKEEDCLMKKTPIDPNPLKGDTKVFCDPPMAGFYVDSNDLLICDECLDDVTNSNQICDEICDGIVGLEEAYFENFEASPKGGERSEVGEPPKRGKIERIYDDFSLSKADMDGKNDCLFSDLQVLYDCGESIFEYDERISKFCDEKVLGNSIWDDSSDFVDAHEVEMVSSMLDFIIADYS